ncbi:hypothetical protein GCM10027170_40070 [Aliiglaciecola aliphaticivorans]
MVPRKLVQYWNTFPLPDDIEELKNTWTTHNPALDYEIFDFEKAADFICSKFGSHTQNLFLSAAIPAMQSDIFRLAYTLSKGGIYIDMATRCKAPIEPLIGDSNKTILMRKWHGGVWNGLIIAPPNSSIISNIWDKVIDNLTTRRYQDVWKATGPFSFNVVTDQTPDDSSCEIYAQKDLRQYFELVNELKHKKTDHWSDVQKKNSIYID